MKNITLAFDVYGTLIDTSGVKDELTKIVGEKALEFTNLWRTKQLEYSFRRGLMQNYKNFSDCIKESLEYTDSYLATNLHTDQKNYLLSLYLKLPVFSDTIEGLKSAKEKGFRLFAFSNGTNEALDTLLTNAGIKQYFLDIVSVDDIKSFKPNPAVYSFFLRKSGSRHNNTWLISSNPFDVCGAISAGLNSCWVKRSKNNIFDPWEIKPDLTVESLKDLADNIISFYSENNG